MITVRRCERPDTAKYRLVLTNTSGSCEGEADVVVLGTLWRGAEVLVAADVIAASNVAIKR